MARVITGFRSGPSRKPVWLQMYNSTSRIVNIIWLDYYGRETNYGILEPRSQKSVHSYEGHPWICRDVTTKRRLLMNSKELYIPTSISNRDRENDIPIISVIISSPIVSLQDMCIDVIIVCLQSEENVISLQMPTRLCEDIIQSWRNANS